MLGGWLILWQLLYDDEFCWRFEYIHTVYEDAMQPFKVLLKHPKASSVRKDNLIKYMALNIFAIDNLFCKQGQYWFAIGLVHSQVSFTRDDYAKQA